MTETMLDATEIPAGREIEIAALGRRVLATFLCTQFESQKIDVFDKDDKAHRVELPTSALRLLMDILGELACGNAVKVVPIHAELTSQEAADMLNVSRPHLVKLLETGAIPFTKTGRHRRVRFEDLMAYKHQRDEESRAALDELAAQAQALGMGYE